MILQNIMSLVVILQTWRVGQSRSPSMSVTELRDIYYK